MSMRFEPFEDECRDQDFPEYGKQCELAVPFRGYRKGTIVSRNGNCFVVEFSSGMRENFYVDELEIDTCASSWR